VVSDAGVLHPELIPSFAKHPKDRVDGQIHRRRVSRVSFECVEAGWQMRVATAPNPSDTALVTRLQREPLKGDELEASTAEGSVVVPGLSWRVWGNYKLSIEKWDLKGEYKGKETVAGSATGRLSWVPWDDYGIKLTPVGGRFVDAPLRYAAKCNIPTHR
jgi:hypothetical protein